MAWSETLKNTTRRCAGDGAMLKSDKGDFGFYTTNSAGGINIIGVEMKNYMPVPTKEIIATFSDIEAMIDAGWVID